MKSNVTRVKEAIAAGLPMRLASNGEDLYIGQVANAGHENTGAQFMEALRRGAPTRMDAAGNLHVDESNVGGEQLNLREAEQRLQDAEQVFAGLTGSSAAGLAAAEKTTGLSRGLLERATAGRTATETLNDAELALYESARGGMGDAAARAFAVGKPQRGRW